MIQNLTDRRRQVSRVPALPKRLRHEYIILIYAAEVAAFRYRIAVAKCGTHGILLRCDGDADEENADRTFDLWFMRPQFKAGWIWQRDLGQNESAMWVLNKWPTVLHDARQAGTCERDHTFLENGTVPVAARDARFHLISRSSWSSAESSANAA